MTTPIDRAEQRAMKTLSDWADALKQPMYEVTELQNLKRRLVAQFREYETELEETKRERDKLFVEVGKWVDVPSFEYWKDRAEKAERELDEAREMSQKRGLANKKLLADNQELIEEHNRLKCRHANLLASLGCYSRYVEYTSPDAHKIAQDALAEDDRLAKEI